MISELIREKVLTYTEEEVPHSINVIIEDMVRNEHGKLQVQATIVTERDSQKGILIGKKGSMLKAIGKAARLDIEQLLGEKIFRSEERRVGKECEYWGWRW